MFESFFSLLFCPLFFCKLVWHCKDFLYMLFWSFMLSPSLLKRFIAQSDNFYNLRHVRDFGNAQSHEISRALQKANRLDCMQKAIVENQSLSRCQKKSYASEGMTCSTLLPFLSSSAISNPTFTLVIFAWETSTNGSVCRRMGLHLPVQLTMMEKAHRVRFLS